MLNKLYDLLILKAPSGAVLSKVDRVAMQVSLEELLFAPNLLDYLHACL